MIDILIHLFTETGFCPVALFGLTALVIYEMAKGE